MHPVSMSDVARAAGVSKNTVSLALRNDPQIPEKTRARISRVARKMGYRRNPVVGDLMARLHSGGARRFQSTLALVNANQERGAFADHPTIPVFVKGCRSRAAELGYNLDFTLYNEVRDWIAESGLRVPDDIALVQYEWRENRPEWPGMNQHNDLAGQAAADMLVGMIHRGERGPPAFPIATLIGPSWTEAMPSRRAR